MRNAGRGKPPNSEAMHSLPVESVALTSSTQRTIPTFRHRLPEGLERIDVGRHGVVRVVSADYGAQPTALLRNRLMQTARQLESNLPNLPSQSGAQGATL